MDEKLLAALVGGASGLVVALPSLLGTTSAMLSDEDGENFS